MKKGARTGNVPENDDGVRTSERDSTGAFHEDFSEDSGKENSFQLHSVPSEEYSVRNTTMNSSNDFQMTSLFQEGPKVGISQEKTMREVTLHDMQGGLAKKAQDETGFSWDKPGLIEKYPAADLASALKDEDFGCFLSLLKSSAGSLKKPTLERLLKILCTITVDIAALVKCTFDPLRDLRYASTFLCCEILRMRVKSGEDTDVLFEKVLMRRYKDVDAGIRSLTISSLMEILVGFPTLFNVGHFNIFAKSITDKNEMVRRKSVRALKKLLGLEGKENLRVLYLRSLKVISDLALFDRCDSVRSECAGLLFALYENKIVKREACFGVLHLAQQRVFKKIFGEIKDEVCGKSQKRATGGTKNVLFPVDALHELLSINEKALGLLKFKQEDLDEYIADIMADLSCKRACKKPFSCKLKILSEIVLPNTPLAQFVDILEIVRENPANIALVLDCLLLIDIRSDSEEADEIVKTLFSLDRNFSHRFQDALLRLLKKIGGTMSSYYVNQVLSEETCVAVARYFDVSHFPSKNVLFQCYCFLWRTISKDFGEVQLEGSFDEDLSGLFNFLLFFKEKAAETSAIQDAIVTFYAKLENYVRMYLEKKKLSQEELVELGKLAKKGILVDGDDPLRKAFLKQKILESFFARVFETGKVDRALAKRVAKETKGTDVFGYAKRCVGSSLEAVCEFFVGHLNQTEAIYLENKSRTKKVRGLLLRKINSGQKDDFPKSPVRENEDVVSL